MMLIEIKCKIKATVQS